MGALLEPHIQGPPHSQVALQLARTLPDKPAHCLDPSPSTRSQISPPGRPPVCSSIEAVDGEPVEHHRIVGEDSWSGTARVELRPEDLPEEGIMD